VALSIGVKKNDLIRIGKSMIRILTVIEPDTPEGNGIIGLSVDRGTEVFVSGGEAVELLPMVRAFCGQVGPNDYPGHSRLALEAPREIKITRVK
jgi:hypothetical protein